MLRDPRNFRRARYLFPPRGLLPIDRTFEPILRAFVVTVGNGSTLEEFDRVFESILADPAAGRMLRLLADLRAPTPPTAEAGEAALVRFERYLSGFDGAELFIVVAPEGRRPRGRLTSVTFGETATIDIFDDMAAAVTAMAMEGMD